MTSFPKSYFPKVAAADVARPDGAVGLTFAAAATRGNQSFPCSVVVSRDGGSTWSEPYSPRSAGTLGWCFGLPLEITAAERSFETVSALQFEVQAGALESLSEARINQGEGRIVIGSELVALETAAQTSTRRFNVSRLYRHLGSTSARYTRGETHASGERFFAMNDAVGFIPYDVSDVGETWILKAVGYGFDEARQPFETVVEIEGIAAVNLPVEGLSGTQDGSGNLTLTLTPGDCGYFNPLRVGQFSDHAGSYFQIIIRDPDDTTDELVADIDAKRLPRDNNNVTLTTPTLPVALKTSYGYGAGDPVIADVVSRRGPWTSPRWRFPSVG